MASILSGSREETAEPQAVFRVFPGLSADLFVDASIFFIQEKGGRGMKKLISALFLVFLWVAVAVAAVNINTASKQDLETLPGIGPAKAEAIIKYREENGPFHQVDDLTQVNGVGQKTIDSIRDSIEVGK
jgi:competence protein ComEA